MLGCKIKGNGVSICALEVILSIIAGIVVGVLFSNGTLAITLNLVLIALAVSAIGIATLIGTIFTTNLAREPNNIKCCTCNLGLCLLIASIGTLVFSTVVVAVGIVTTSIVSILAIALTTFFFAWTIASIASILLCLISSTCN